MFQYRQVLLRLRQGDSDRDIARSGLMGRPKVGVFRLLAGDEGWLKPEARLPDDAAIAALISAPRRARSTISTVEPYRAQVERWVGQGVGGVAIHAALCREHGFRGSYSAVRRMLVDEFKRPSQRMPRTRRRRRFACTSPRGRPRSWISARARFCSMPNASRCAAPGRSS